MVTRDKVIEILRLMPETFPVDDLIERILILEKIEKAQKEMENGEGMDWGNFKKEMDKW